MQLLLNTCLVKTELKNINNSQEKRHTNLTHKAMYKHITIVNIISPEDELVPRSKAQ